MDACPNFLNYFNSWGHFSQEQMEELMKLVQVRHVARQEVILKSGEVCNYMFFVEKGLIRAYTIDQAGKEHIIQFGTENWIVSDRSSAYFHEPSEMFIDAVEASTVIGFDDSFRDKAVSMSPNFRKNSDRALQNHIRHLQKRINMLLSASAEQRYMEFIRLYPDVMLRAPQWMIASYLGVTPESLSRVRKELAAKNFKTDKV